MEGSSNSSFIPKRNPNRQRRTGGRQVYLFTIISYVLFVAAIVSSIGVFLYQRYVNAQMVKEVGQLNEEIGRFNEADMDRVKDFDLRLVKAHTRLNNSVSLTSVFTALEEATVQTVQIKSLNLARKGDQGFELTTLLETNNFDSSIFQREMYEQNSTIKSVQITDVDIQDIESGVEDQQSTAKKVSLSAVLGVPLSSVLYSPSPESIPVFDDLPVSDSIDSTSSSSDEFIETPSTDGEEDEAVEVSEANETSDPNGESLNTNQSGL